MSDTFVQGYPNSIGQKDLVIWDHTGPTSYSNIGTSSGTGDSIPATALGHGGFDTFEMTFGGFTEGYTQSGNYVVKVFTGSSGTTPSQSISSGEAFPTVILQWFTTSSAFGAISTEVTNATNLSAEKIRFKAIMI